MTGKPDANRLMGSVRRLQVVPEFQVMLGDMVFETALHENHECRNIAFAATDLANLRLNEGSKLAMLLEVALVERDTLRPGGLLLPCEMRDEILGKTGKQRQAICVIARNLEQCALDLHDLVEEPVVLIIHLRNARQQLGRHVNFIHDTPSEPCLRNPLIEQARLHRFQVLPPYR